MRVYQKALLAALAATVGLNAQAAPIAATPVAPPPAPPPPAAAASSAVPAPAPTVVVSQPAAVATSPLVNGVSPAVAANAPVLGGQLYPGTVGQVVPGTVDGTMTPVNILAGIPTFPTTGLPSLNYPYGFMNFGAPASAPFVNGVKPITTPGIGVAGNTRVVVPGGPTVTTTVPTSSVIVTGGTAAAGVPTSTVIVTGGPAATAVPAGAVAKGVVVASPSGVIVTGGAQ
jgi:hypothetical protein